MTRNIILALLLSTAPAVGFAETAPEASYCAEGEGSRPECPGGSPNPMTSPGGKPGGPVSEPSRSDRLLGALSRMRGEAEEVGGIAYDTIQDRGPDIVETGRGLAREAGELSATFAEEAMRRVPGILDRVAPSEGGGVEGRIRSFIDGEGSE